MFIYKRENAISHELCNTFIDTFENSNLKQEGKLYNKDGFSTDGKKSTDITFNPSFLQDEQWGTPLSQLITILQKNIDDYKLRFGTAFQNIDPIDVSPTFNMQRYEPNEGFFQYHCERASRGYLDRVLVWMVYLNDVDDRGETEFLYQHQFERPTQGTLLIWPSDWTHTHRGISSPTQTKYILTGWVNHIQPQQ
jgi:hypothetical protein